MECFKATVEIFIVRLLSKRCSTAIESSQVRRHVPVISQHLAAWEPETLSLKLHLKHAHTHKTWGVVRTDENINMF